MNILITLTTAGAGTGPTFSLYSNVDSFTNPFESGVSKAALVEGYYTSIAPDGTITVRVKSSGPACTNYVDLPVVAITTTTTTSTSTSTSTTTTTAVPTTTTTTTAEPTTTTTTTLEPTTTTTTTLEPTTTTTTTAEPTTTTTTTLEPTTTTTTTLEPTTTTTTTIASVYKPFTVAGGLGTLAGVCPSDTYPYTFYFTGAGTYPTVDDTVYTLASAIYTPFEFSGGWIKMSNGHAISGYGTSGVVTFDNTCAAPSQSYWYRAENCTTQQDIFSIEYTQPTFRIGDRITYGLGTFVVAQISETPLSGSEFAFVNTGLTGCPEVTSTTTTTSTTVSPVPMWTGYNLIPVTFGTCDSAGPNITAYKYYDDGSIINGDILYATQDLNDKLATGYYADGGYRYEVNTGTVSNKTACVEPTTTTTTTPTPTTTTTTTPTPTTTTTTTAPLACYSCNDAQETFTTLATGSGSYPQREVCSTSSTYFIFNWSVQERPNVFGVYDANGLIWSSGWVGVANYPGPWGASLNTATGGSSALLQFTSESGRYVLIQYGNADPSNPIGDSATWSLTCAVAPTTTTTIAPRYSFIVYPTVDEFCNYSGTITEVYSFTNYSNGFYIVNGTGTKQYVESNGHSNYTNLVTLASSPCIPATTTTTTTVPPTTTTTTTLPPPPPTTTTTTTFPPVDFTYTTSCAGGEGTGVITITGMSGGNGVNYEYSIQPTPGTWYPYPSTNQLTGLANSTYNVAARAQLGSGTNKSIGISCVNPTTTTTTTIAATQVYSLRECNVGGPATEYTDVTVGTGSTYYVNNICYTGMGYVDKGTLNFAGNDGTVDGCSC